MVEIAEQRNTIITYDDDIMNEEIKSDRYSYNGKEIHKIAIVYTLHKKYNDKRSYRLRMQTIRNQAIEGSLDEVTCHSLMAARIMGKDNIDYEPMSAITKNCKESLRRVNLRFLLQKQNCKDERKCWRPSELPREMISGTTTLEGWLQQGFLLIANANFYYRDNYGMFIVCQNKKDYVVKMVEITGMVTILSGEKIHLLHIVDHGLMSISTIKSEIEKKIWNVHEGYVLVGKANKIETTKNYD